MLNVSLGQLLMQSVSCSLKSLWILHKMSIPCMTLKSLNKTELIANIFL